MAGAGGQQAEEGGQLRGAFYLGELPDVAVDEVLHVRVVEPAAAARVGARDGFGQAAADDPVGVASAADV